MLPSKHPASFRDPSSFVFSEDGVFYRCLNSRYKENYERLMSSGLYEGLVNGEELIAHEEVDLACKLSDSPYKIIKPTQIPFISYPYEWSFHQLKDAALLTLKIQKRSLAYDMSLKDASAFNIQFYKGKPIFIDTPSFEKLTLKPWVAYRQFCQHFLAPLMLMKYVDLSMNQLLSFYLDGIPLELASKLLPMRTVFKFNTLLHVRLHARSQKKYSGSYNQETAQSKNKLLSKNQLLGLIDSLEAAVKSLDISEAKTEWGDYYDFHNYKQAGFEHKKQLLSDYLQIIKPKKVWDIGGNTGEFSEIACSLGDLVVNTDIDPLAIDKLYGHLKSKKVEKILPLVSNFVNPSANIGFMNNEREGFLERVKDFDVILALALIHHLAISNNIPLKELAQGFSQLSKHLIIEFVPKSDSQVRRMLQTREDIFGNYNIAAFEAIFSQCYNITRKDQIQGSERTMYLLERK